MNVSSTNFIPQATYPNPVQQPQDEHADPTDKAAEKSPKNSEPPTSAGANAARTEPSQQELKHIKELKQRDQEVRTHEAAHRAAAGPYVRNGTSYTYQRGPDGVNYAIGGEVDIDTSHENGDPEANLKKAETIRAAALAPAQPSNQDYAVAAKAAAMEAKAKAELQEQRNASEAAPGIAENENASESGDDEENSSEAAVIVPERQSQNINRYQQVAAISGEQTAETFLNLVV